MSRFSYIAKAAQDQVSRGFVEAQSLEEAIRKVIQSGVTPIEVSAHEADGKKEPFRLKKGSLFLRKIKVKDVALFTRKLSDLIEASVPILKSLHLIARQTSSVALKNIISEMEQHVVEGGSLADALMLHPEVFSSFYIELVRTGEASGQLTQVLKRISMYLEKEQETRKKIMSALSYPMFVLGVGAITMVVFITFVIPKISVMFIDLGQNLPGITSFLIHTSAFVVEYGWLIVLLTAGLIFYVYRFANTPSGQYKLDSLSLRVPVYGSFLKTIEIGHAARTLSTLLDAGVPITTSLNLLWATMNSRVFQQEMIKVPSYIAEGMTLNKALEKTGLFDEMPLNMISVGEETGDLGQSFHKIADIYERQSEESLKIILSLLGPAMLVFIVLIIGLMLVAMLLPIFEMNLII